VTLVAVVLAPEVLVGVVLAGAAARALAASLSDVTAVSSALVADEIAVSALVSVLADVAAWVAAAFSLVEAEVTLVAAEATVRGVTVDALPVVERPVVERPVVARPVDEFAVDLRFAVLRAAVVVPVAAPVLAAAGLAALVVLVVRARELPRAEFATRGVAALAVALFVGGTDLLPPIWISYRGGHSTESNVLHIKPPKTAGKGESTVTFRYYSSAATGGGTSSRTIRSASSGEAPRPTATPIR
jgi:hypothetical protein